MAKKVKGEYWGGGGGGGVEAIVTQNHNMIQKL